MFPMEVFAFLSRSYHVFTFLSYLHLTQSVAHIFRCFCISSSFSDFYLYLCEDSFVICEKWELDPDINIPIFLSVSTV